MDSLLGLWLGVREDSHFKIFGFPLFGLDEIVLGFQNIFEKKAYSALIECYIENCDFRLSQLLSGKFTNTEALLNALKFTTCCDGEIRFEKVRIDERKMITSLCELNLKLTRLRCINCKKSFVPMTGTLGIKKYQNKSNEVLKKIIEMLVDQTYRRGLSQLQKLTAIKMSLGQIWRAVMENELFEVKMGCENLNGDNFKNTMDEAIKKIIKKDPLYAILADGTGFKLQKKPENLSKTDSKFNEKSRPLQSEVRIIYGITKKNQTIPLGVYSDKESWKEIGKDLYQRFGRHPDLKPEPIAELLIADGEEALFKGLRRLVKKEQRCQWHFTHDFKAVFQYQDDGKKEDRTQYQSEIQSTMDNLHEKVMSGEKLTDDKKLELQAEIIKAELALDELSKKLKENNYYSTSIYVKNASKNLFNYLKNYILHGILGPKVTSLLERFMREIGRRLKRIAWNWSTRGVSTLCYLILVKTMSKELWESYWEKILNVSGGFILTFESVILKNQQNKILH